MTSRTMHRKMASAAEAEEKASLVSRRDECLYSFFVNTTYITRFSFTSDMCIGFTAATIDLNRFIRTRLNNYLTFPPCYLYLHQLMLPNFTRLANNLSTSRTLPSLPVTFSVPADAAQFHPFGPTICRHQDWTDLSSFFAASNYSPQLIEQTFASWICLPETESYPSSLPILSVLSPVQVSTPRRVTTRWRLPSKLSATT